MNRRLYYRDAMNHRLYGKAIRDDLSVGAAACPCPARAKRTSIHEQRGYKKGNRIQRVPILLFRIVYYFLSSQKACISTVSFF